jgi:hypothetical protein
MKKIVKQVIFVFFLIIMAGTLTVSCRKDRTAPDPQYVAAVSGGVLGRNEPVIIEFTRDQDTSKPLAANVFSFSPSVKGTASWHNEYTLVFTPSEPYRPGQQYWVRVNLSGIPAFDFDFMTLIPSFALHLDHIQVSGNDDIIVSGTVIVDEDADVYSIEKTVSSGELGTPWWSHEDGVHRFSFNPVSRGETSRTVEVTWDGSPLGVDERGFTSVMIPGIDTFEMVGLRLNNGIIEVSFSSPLRANQDVRGFISLSGNTNVRYSLEGNIVRIFGDNSGAVPSGAELLIQDLENINGQRLAVPVRYTVPDRWELPEIRFAGTGVVLPTSQGSNLVVETRNVTGILVEAFHIHGNNMLQFLQINNLSGERELDRVGEPVWTSAIDFPWTEADQNRWVRRGLDLSELSRRFPGGMFHIRISFRSRHVQYVCTVGHGDFSHLVFPDDSFPAFRTGTGEYSGWDYSWGVAMSVPGANYWNAYTNSPGFNWSEWNRHRNDPCHPAFYVPMSGRNITRGRNVHVSNLGLMARRELDGSWLLAATNLITARSSPNTEFRIYNYQGRVLHQGRTGADGMAVIPASVETGSGSRLVIYAENNLGRAYLRVNDSLALAVSHFDIAGGSPATGIRGLIYGERGVWRPGDEVFLTFLLSDPLGTLPRNHPVSFELEDPRGRPVLSRTYTASVDGFFPISFSTSPDAPTGNWTARVRVGSNTFSRRLMIETVMPNRLKIDLDFGDGGIIKSGPRQVSLESQWLFGAQAPGLKSDVSVGFSDRETTFVGFPDFSFRDPSRTVSSQRQNIWEGNLDDTGRAQFQMSLNPGTAVPGKVTARFMTRVFEPSGVFSTEHISVE